MDDVKKPPMVLLVFRNGRFVWSFSILLIAYLSGTSSALDRERCTNPLGMTSGEIPDSAITASSSYDSSNLGPDSSRLLTEHKGGAWCPVEKIKEGVYEYLQIDFGKLTVITKVTTQGRFGNGRGKEFAPYYMIDYQREDGNWTRFRNISGYEVFVGNSHYVWAPIDRPVNPPIIATRIRFVPYSYSVKGSTVCMRVEAIGCDWTDHLVSYSMPQGQSMGNQIDLYDNTYDGDVTVPNYLSDGLGQLTDGEVGETNFRLANKMGAKGYQWVGWKNETGNTEPVSILFKFDSVRNFTSAKIHCNNYFPKHVRIIRRAEVSFSIGGTIFSPDKYSIYFQRDGFFDDARFLNFNLMGGVGRYLKMDLYFHDKWLLISEVAFESAPAVGNFSEETPAPPPTTTTTTPTTNATTTVENTTQTVNHTCQVPAIPGHPAMTRVPHPTMKDRFLVGICILALCPDGETYNPVTQSCSSQQEPTPPSNSSTSTPAAGIDLL